MNAETAARINSAACFCWFFQEGIHPQLAWEHIKTINSVSIAQIETATEVIEAENRAAAIVNDIKTFRCTLDAAAVPRLKSFIASLKSSKPGED